LDLAMKVNRAVKVVPHDRFRESTVRRLKAEAQKMARLPPHPNRVQVHRLEDNVTNCFVVMDFVDGGGIHKQTSPARPLPWGRAARYVAGVGAALADMHALDLLHLDIKPDNIFLDTARDEAVLGDFGLVAFLDELRGYAGGTDGYMASEVLRGGASVKSDVF